MEPLACNWKSGKTEEFWAITAAPGLLATYVMAKKYHGLDQMLPKILVSFDVAALFNLYLLFSSDFYGPLCDRRFHIGNNLI